MLLHVLCKITLGVHHFIADRANVRLFFCVFAHVSEQLIERSECLMAHAAC